MLCKIRTPESPGEWPAWQCDCLRPGHRSSSAQLVGSRVASSIRVVVVTQKKFLPLKTSLQDFSSNSIIISPWKFTRPSLPLSNWFQYLKSWFYKCDMHAVCTFLCVVVHIPNGKSFYWITSNQNVIKITSSYIHGLRQVKCHGLCHIAPPWKFSGCGQNITILLSHNIIWKRTDGRYSTLNWISVMFNGAFSRWLIDYVLGSGPHGPDAPRP
jgi:hypothetical protein